MHHKKISDTVFAFVDTETTALYPSEYGRVCEIAVIKRFPDGRRQNYCQLINPQVPICRQATAIHGITDEMVKTKPAFYNVAKKILSILEGSVLVFHHSDFDIPFLSYEFTEANLRFCPPVVLDTLKYARKHGSFRSNSLGVIAGELGISNTGWHRALADACMTEKIFFHFLNKFCLAGIKTLGELEKLQKKKLTHTGSIK